MKDSFFERSEYQQLIYCAIRTLFDDKVHLEKIRMLMPAIIKPKEIWTGKQLISTIIKLIANFDFEEGMDADMGKEGLYYQYKCKVTEKNFSSIDLEEMKVTLRDNELLTGLVDKASIGSTAFGLVHIFYELNGSKKTGKLLTALSRLFSAFLQMRGFTCSLHDLVTSEEFNKSRNDQLEALHKEGAESIVKFCGYKDYKLPEPCKLFNRMDLSVPVKKRIKKILKYQPNVDYMSKNSLAAQSVAEKHIMDKEGQALVDGEVKSAVKDFVSKINTEA